MTYQKVTGQPIAKTKTAYGLDSYNQTTSYEQAAPLRSHDGGNEIAKVIIVVRKQYDLSESDRSTDGKQPSGKLLRSGRIQ